MASCPSAKTSASTVTSSPMVRLIGNRPHSSSGFTPRMTTRSGGRSLIFRAYHVKILLFLREILETGMKRSIQAIAVVCIGVVFLAACSRKPQPKAEDNNGLIFGIKLNGPLVSSRTTMATAWVVPKNPLEDKTLDNSKLSNEIKLGFKLFTNTPHE